MSTGDPQWYTSDLALWHWQSGTIIICPGALRGFQIRVIMSRNMIISITHPPRQLQTWEYYHQNCMIKLDFMRCQQQVLECFWKSDQKSTLIAGFQTRNKQGTSRGSKLVHIGDLHMGLISHLQCMG